MYNRASVSWLQRKTDTGLRAIQISYLVHSHNKNIYFGLDIFGDRIRFAGGLHSAAACHVDGVLNKASAEPDEVIEDNVPKERLKFFVTIE